MPGPAVDEVEARWRTLAEAVVTGFRAWRTAHPTATLAEIERAVDERWPRARARLVEEAAPQSAAAGLPRAGARPACPARGAPMRADGAEERRLTTTGEPAITVRRTRARCPACGAGLFPPR